MSDLIQSVTILLLGISSFANGRTLERLRREIDELRHNDADLAKWILHHDPYLYEAWQKRHPTN